MTKTDMLTFIVALTVAFAFFGILSLNVGGSASNLFPICEHSQTHHFAFVTICDSGR
jgi:hypothetical protein